MSISRCHFAASRPRALSRRSLGAAAAGAGLLLAAAAPSIAAEQCRTVKGTYVEHAVQGPDCLSAVGLCIAGTYSGQLSGDFDGRATSIQPTADTSITSVALFTSDSTIRARVHGRTGTLLIKNAGAFSSAAPGSIVDVQTIVGGTGRLAGATGSLRAEGTFSIADGGSSRYAGTICLP
jgi:Protein of unknown function (DUF3224)